MGTSTTLVASVITTRGRWILLPFSVCGVSLSIRRIVAVHDRSKNALLSLKLCFLMPLCSGLSSASIAVIVIVIVIVFCCGI